MHKVGYVLEMNRKKLLFNELEYILTGNLIYIIISFLQRLEFDREGLTKLKKAVKAIHNSGNSKLIYEHISD